MYFGHYNRDEGSDGSCVTDSEQDDPNESIFIDLNVVANTVKIDSDSSSLTTPVNKKSASHPFGSSASNHSSSGHLNVQEAAATSGAEKLKRHEVMNGKKTEEAQGSKKKASSLSLLSQLSDVVMSDVATKAKNMVTSNYNKKRASLLNEEVTVKDGKSLFVH